MIEILRTNDPVLISFVEATLKEENIFVAVLDTNISILDGSIGVLPRRMMVVSEDATAALRILRQTEAAQALSSDFAGGKWD